MRFNDMAKKYKLTQDGPEVQALLNKIDGIRANQTQEQGVELIQMENLSLDGVLYAFLTSAVSNLLYYYTKSETYSKSEVDALVAAIKQFTIQSVDALPQPPSADTMNILYLVPAEEPKVANEKDEFITVIKDGSYAWEQVGSTAIDLSGYVTTEALNTALAGYVTSGALETALAGKQDNINDLQTIRDGAAAGATAYQKPSTGIPASDLATGVIPTIPTDMVKYTAQTLTDAQKSQARTNIGAGTYSKPSSGIPAGDLASGVIPDVSQFITRSVNDLANYYLKSEVYTKDEVASLIGAIQQFHYEIAASTSAVTNPSNNVLYLIGPTGSGADKYEEYVYDTTKPVAERWVKIGDTSIDLSGYVTTQALNTALSAYTTTNDLTTLLAGKQDTIDAQHKLDYSLLSNTPSIPAAQVPADWNASEGVSRILNKPNVPTTYAGSPTAGGFANKAVAIPFGSVDDTSTATELTATVDNFPTTLTDGVCAYIRNNVVASASGFTLNINGTGAKPVYQTLSDDGRVTTVFKASCTFLFVYNSTRVEGGCWDLYYGYNSNDNTIGYILRTNSTRLKMKSITYRYRLLFTSADGKHWVPANNSTSTNATAKRTVCEDKIDPFGRIVYYGTTASVAANSLPAAAYMFDQQLVTLGYSFNRTGAALVLTIWSPVYVKATPQTDGSVIIDPDTPYVQTLPSIADGDVYIFLGVAISETQIELHQNHPVYYHDGTRVSNWPGPVIGDIQTALDAIIGKSLISFSVTLGGTISYQAEEGMTWGDWVESEYNTDGWTNEHDATSRNYIWKNGHAIYYNHNGVLPTDTILNNTAYTTADVLIEV